MIDREHNTPSFPNAQDYYYPNHNERSDRSSLPSGEGNRGGRRPHAFDPEDSFPSGQQKDNGPYDQDFFYNEENLHSEDQGPTMPSSNDQKNTHSQGRTTPASSNHQITGPSN